jgi:hypothetical protein
MSAVSWPTEFARIISCVACSRGTDNSILRDAYENVPQPGYVGENYRNHRVALVGQNENAGNPGQTVYRRVAENERHAKRGHISRTIVFIGKWGADRASEEVKRGGMARVNTLSLNSAMKTAQLWVGMGWGDTSIRRISSPPVRKKRPASADLTRATSAAPSANSAINPPCERDPGGRAFRCPEGARAIGERIYRDLKYLSEYFTNSLGFINQGRGFSGLSTA